MGTHKRNRRYYHGEVPHAVTLVSFIAAAALTTLISKAMDLNHVMGLVPLGGFIGSVLSALAWRAIRKT